MMALRAEETKHNTYERHSGDIMTFTVITRVAA